MKNLIALQQVSRLQLGRVLILPFASMKPITDELLIEVTRRLVKELEPEEIILFGSYAWGTPHK